MKNHNGMEAEFIDYGARLVSLLVPDKKNNKKDVVLGFDTVEDYETSDTYYGAFIGRNGNRIQNGEFSLNKKKYILEKNSGNHNLHSGFEGYDKKMYEVETFEEEGEVSVEFSRLSPDMEQGFPGNLDITVTYTLTEDNALVMEYFAVGDQDTLVNLTNHSYFNLGGHDSGDVLQHKVKIASANFALTDEELIPTGELVPVEGTPMDFRVWKAIGEDIEADYAPLKNAGGYDHHFVFDQADKEVTLVAEAKEEESGICMEVYSDMPGLQFYTGNFIKGKEKGKGGYKYQKRAGFCFETQYIPNSVNLKNIDTCILPKGKTFDSTTVFHFGHNK